MSCLIGDDCSNVCICQVMDGGNLISSFLLIAPVINGHFRNVFIYFLSFSFFLNEFQSNKFSCCQLRAVVGCSMEEREKKFKDFFLSQKIKRHKLCVFFFHFFFFFPLLACVVKSTTFNGCWHRTKSQRKCAINFVCASSLCIHQQHKIGNCLNLRSSWSVNVSNWLCRTTCHTFHVGRNNSMELQSDLSRQCFYLTHDQPSQCEILSHTLRPFFRPFFLLWSSGCLGESAVWTKQKNKIFRESNLILKLTV